ncbi:hypothetical protein UM93_04175 [Psychromicrobium lacuslunae]|uniref:Uncharacterized protein n=1 Tax=Psychromicrobium lacuslunae TaxID=1618207 RepID=A0A0D4BX56_9MICC|nr:hypothetical protein UM93_04175 [Psychromicrobium lacuslunae]
MAASSGYPLNAFIVKRSSPDLEPVPEGNISEIQIALIVDSVWGVMVAAFDGDGILLLSKDGIN